MRTRYSLITPLALALALLSACREPSYLRPVKPLEQPILENRSHTEKFTVQMSDKLDILWVIDNSASMGNHQANVIRNANEFFNQLKSSESPLDWKLGLISTDVREAPYVGFTDETAVNSRTIESLVRFQAAVSRLGLNGSADESTFDTTLKAIRENPGFLRSDANLALVIVTDEYEQSKENTVDSFIDQMKTIKPIVGSFHVHAILGGAAFECRGSAFVAWDPFKLLIEKLEGKTYPICSEDFGSRLAAVAEDMVATVAAQRRVVLAHRPKAETIQVRYQGNLVPGGAPGTGGKWTYDYDRNAVVFHDRELGLGYSNELEIIYEEKVR